MRYAAARREPNPASDPRSSRHATRSGLAYARRSNPPRTADFQRRLSVRAFPSRFLGSIRRLGGYEGPPRLHFTQKPASEGAAGRLQLAPSVPLRVKLGATCLTAAYLPGADSGPRPAPSRPRGRVRDWGRALRRSAAWSLNPLGIFNSPRSRSSLTRNAPIAPESAKNPRPRGQKTARALRRTRGGSG